MSAAHKIEITAWFLSNNWTDSSKTLQEYVLVGSGLTVSWGPAVFPALCHPYLTTFVKPSGGWTAEKACKKHEGRKGCWMQSMLRCLIDTSIQPRVFKGNALAWPRSVRGHCYIQTDNSSLNHLPEVNSTAENVVYRCD